MKYNTNRELWTAVERKVEGLVHSEVWYKVSKDVKLQQFEWFRIMDRVHGLGWRRFSPEVSGNVL